MKRTDKDFESMIDTKPYAGVVKLIWGKDEIISYMKQAYNLAIDDTAENAELKTIDSNVDFGYDKSVDKDNILNLKIK